MGRRKEYRLEWRHVLAFTVPGPPLAKGRPRFARVGDGVRTFTPAATAHYEDRIRLCATIAAVAAGESLPIVGPIRLDVLVVLTKPASAPRRRVAAIKRPDLDNYVKTLDGLDAILKDDAQVIEIHARKVYGEPARMEVSIDAADVVEAEPDHAHAWQPLPDGVDVCFERDTSREDAKP